MLLRICVLSLALLGVSEAETSTEKGALLTLLAKHPAGQPVSEAAAAQIDAAASALEAAAPTPQLADQTAAVSGLWTNLYSSQGIVGEIDLKFMTRTFPGGGQKGGKAKSLTVLQELQPDRRFYRNMMNMVTSDGDVPFLYIATADLGISTSVSNDLEVAFHTITFAPASADVSLATLRQALGLAEDSPLSISVPQDPNRPPSTSRVTYLDDDLRINRGKDYVAILRKVQ
ncbi:MAG: PAP/fibrillin family protein [Pseudomonadota bacterium]